MLNRLRMRHVRCFLTIARCGSMTAAAKEMNSSQPAVSRSLAELETLVGQPLFERGGRGLTLTEAGERLRRHLDPAVSQMEEGVRLAGGTVAVPRVSVGVLPNVARTLAMRSSVMFKADTPDVDLELHWANVSELITRLNRGEIDMLLGRLLSLEHMEGVSFEHLYPEDIVFAVHHTHPFAARPEEVTLSEVGAELVVVPLGGTIIRRELDKFMTARGLARFRRQIETVSFEFTRSFLRETPSVAAIPLGAIRRELAEGELVKLGLSGEELAGSVGISFRTGRALSPEAARFADAVRIVARDYA
ncbi:MAG: LysR substrate-binding domain-containing protein [Sagittula sp.]|uniref:LysR substrate-binding domain-containing protein n=1 Tax=Sagittula sp. TaxID=2038081 RepID=UPI00405A122B